MILRCGGEQFRFGSAVLKLSLLSAYRERLKFVTNSKIELDKYLA